MRIARLSLLAFVAALVALGAAVNTALAADRYQKIELPWPSEVEREAIRSMPDLELMEIDEGRMIRLLSTPELTERLIDAGLAPAVVVDDLEAFYSGRQREAMNFGVFFTYTEAVAEMDDIHADFPDITTAKMQIGTTIEGRAIWAMKISDNPDLEEGEPEVLFDALHHAREPISVSVLLNTMRHLCQNYETDPEATFLVDNRQIWFVPMVNPDGYVYNETTNPQGGGMWRKNRRDIDGSTCYGVDLNRNYGFMWGGPGSSSDPCSETYRGTAGFSEPETQALRDFIIDHEFVTHDSYHSVVGAILYPWGYTSTYTPDHALFQAIAAERVRDSGYVHHTSYELYVTSGTSVDWAYGEQVLKPKMISFTTEVGGSDFWPLESEVPGLVAENLYSNIYLSQVAGPYLTLSGIAVVGGDGNGRLDPGETADLVVTLENVGVIAAAENITLTLASNDAYVQMVDAETPFPDLDPGSSASNALSPFRVTVDAGAPAGHDATFEVRAVWSTGTSEGQTVLTIGLPPVIAADDFESGNNGWSQDPSHTATTGAWVIVDPNPTEFQPGDDTTPPPGTMCWVTGQNSSLGVDDVDGGVSALRSPTWDFSAHQSVRIRLNYFHGQRDAGSDPGDYFRIDMSNDGGATFSTPMVQFGDIYHAPTWLALDFNVEDYVPLTSQMVLRFRACDATATGDIIEGGLDDLVIFDNGTGNEPPTAPRLLSPVNGAVGQPAATPLTVINGTDPDGDPLTYGFRVYADALLTSPIRSVDGVAEAPFVTSWTVNPPLANGTYWWRAYAEDAEERSPFMEPASFTVGQPVAIGEDGGSAALFALEPPSPNPFQRATEVRFSLPVAGKSRVEIFDVNGRRVRALFRGVLPAGQQTMVWDGRDERGERVGAGEYFVQVLLEGRVFTRKVVVLD